MVKSKERFDFIFVDGDKPGYIDYFKVSSLSRFVIISYQDDAMSLTKLKNELCYFWSQHANVSCLAKSMGFHLDHYGPRTTEPKWHVGVRQCNDVRRRICIGDLRRVWYRC